MISDVKITICIDGKTETARLVCDNKAVSITFIMNSGLLKLYTDTNFYKCFGNVRKDNPHIQFLCKGSKINVHPSSMSTQMTLGVKAYELTLEKKPSLDDLIYIFDYEENNLTNDPNEQEEFFKKWIASKKE
ncbi:hypothetical protein J2Y86_005382 [Pseudomonas migulae]|uniref:hypothetical protein n=1 Tax=Pseudomonas migulae TaxID=78543 RepID=UPI00209DD5C4|nr:hypothetical protein [Pseudomonas migulae]MCP1500675.1 hypothetical protein [Pseudomonas migulae]